MSTPEKLYYERIDGNYFTVEPRTPVSDTMNYSYALKDLRASDDENFKLIYWIAVVLTLDHKYYPCHYRFRKENVDIKFDPENKKEYPWKVEPEDIQAYPWKFNPEDEVNYRKDNRWGDYDFGVWIDRDFYILLSQKSFDILKDILEDQQWL